MIASLSLLSLLLFSPLALVVAVLVSSAIILLIKVLISWQRLQFYKKQGGIVKFFPLKGYLGFESMDIPENKKGQNYNHVIQLTAKYPEARFMASNQFASQECVVLLFNKELISQYFLKEESFLKVPFYEDQKEKFGLVFENGEKFHTLQSAFTKIFGANGLESYIPKLCRFIQEGFEKIITKENINTGDWKEINLPDLFAPVIDGLVNLLVFGEESIEMSEDVTELMNLSRKQAEASFNVMGNILLHLMPYLSKKLKLIPALTKSDEILQQQKELVQKLIDQRNRENRPPTECILDRMIMYNRKCDEEGRVNEKLSINDFATTVFFFQFAGSDTSQAISISTICHLADNPVMKNYWERVTGEVLDNQGNTTLEILEGNLDFKMCVKESLRLYSSALRFAARKATKDLSLGDLAIKKGDYVAVQPGAILTNPHEYTDPQIFNPDRFKGRNASEQRKLELDLQKLIFGAGRRPCLGRYIGELMVQLLVTQFLRRFDVCKPEGHEYFMLLTWTRATENPLVKVRRRY